MSARGRRELVKIAGRSERTGLPIVIQRTGDDEADLARRGHVLSEIQALGLGVSEDMVLLDYAKRGLSGEEAVIMHGRLVRQTASGGGGTGTGNLSGAVFPQFSGGGQNGSGGSGGNGQGGGGNQ